MVAAMRGKHYAVAQAACYGVSFIAGFVFGLPMEGWEFSGGSVTGRLMAAQDWSLLIFILALLVTFWFRRVGAALGIVASVLSLPLYLYFVFPRPFQALTGGIYSMPATRYFAWNSPAVLCVAIAAVTIAVCVKGLAYKSSAAPTRN